LEFRRRIGSECKDVNFWKLYRTRNFHKQEIFSNQGLIIDGYNPFRFAKEEIKMELGPAELIIILIIVLLLFGVGRIGKIGGELGAGIRSFREGLKGDEPGEKAKPTDPKVEEIPSDKIEK
jgi:sec-independent protein translocase protein TatA